jgi:nitroreductase
MTSSLVGTNTAAALRQAAVRATLAPSVHNTQPWRFAIRPGVLEIHADWSRALAALDPSGRQLTISCGCALFNARVALARAGVPVRVERLAADRPDPGGPRTLLARLVVDAEAAPDAIGALDPMIDLRQSNRRRFADEQVGDDVIADLERAAQAERGRLTLLRDGDQRYAAARLTQQADREQNADAAYRAEIRAWTTTDLSRADGVPNSAVPHVGGTVLDDLPIRDFDSRGEGLLPSDTGSGVRQCLLVLTTDEDDPGAWLRAGEALEHLWLEGVRRGYTMSLLTQAIELPWTREALRRDLRLAGHPHLVLRLGRAPRTPSTRRRRLVDVLSETF